MNIADFANEVVYHGSDTFIRKLAMSFVISKVESLTHDLSLDPRHSAGPETRPCWGEAIYGSSLLLCDSARSSKGGDLILESTTFMISEVIRSELDIDNFVDHGLRWINPVALVAKGSSMVGALRVLFASEITLLIRAYDDDGYVLAHLKMAE